MSEVQKSDLQKPEKEQSAEELWTQAAKDRSSTQADETPAPQETVKPETPQATPEDPLASLPEPTRKLVEQIQAKTAEQDNALKEVGQKLARAHGTIGNLTKRLQDSLETLQKMQPTVAAVEARQKVDAEAAAMAKEEKKKQLREKLADIPDVLEYLDAVVPDEKPAAKPEIRPEPKPQQVAHQVEQETPQEGVPSKELMNLHLELHRKSPGWEAKRDSEEFKAWLPKQSEEVRKKASSYNVDEAADVIKAFDKYTQDAAKAVQVEADRQARLRRGETVQGSGTAQTGTAVTPDSLWEQAKRDRAKRAQFA